MPVMKSIAAHVVGTVLLVLQISTEWAEARDLQAPMNFEGRYLVSVQDADMVASAYVDGQLGPREGRDSLSVIQLHGDPREWKAAEVFASNSVAGPPAAVDISPDGRFAIVIETWTERPDNDLAHTFSDLAPGRTLSVFDLQDPANPMAVQRLEGLVRPDSVRFNHDASLVAITYHPAGGGTETPITLHRFENGRISSGFAAEIDGWIPGERLIDVAWHPEQNILALLDGSGGATVTFARVTPNLAIEPFGNVVDVERAPFRIFFTPDGRHAVINALYWGPDIAGTWIEAPVGSINTIRMNAEIRPDGTVRHAFVDRVMTGVSPEGLAVSPDGRWVATTNLERSYLPYDDERITWYASVTLAALDQETGDLTEIGTFAYDGILPEAAVFDNSSNYLAVANFDHFDDRVEGSSIDFWRIQTDPLDPGNTQLIKTEHAVPVARGAHSMVIAR